MLVPADRPKRVVARKVAGLTLLLFVLLGARGVVAVDASGTGDTTQGAITMQATGTFTVDMQPQAPDAGHEEAAIGRMLLDKRYQGDLVATALGQMLAVRTPVEGSAGYVAIERVTGTLAGRTGSFTLQHSGTMTAGEPHLDLHVIPDSGTDALTGIAGTMAIRIEDGDHFYDFDYTLP